MKNILILWLALMFGSPSHLGFATSICNGKQIWGSTEKVMLIDKNILVDAKLDTGAAMSSLSATDIVTFKKDNLDWVQFSLNLPGKKIIFTKPLVGNVKILNRKEEINIDKRYSKRLVVKLEVVIENQRKMILVNLADRRDFRYPMLLGKSALKEFNVLVDVSRP